VYKGHVSGIIDWEHAGYYPDWLEYANASTLIEEAEWQYYILAEMEKQLKTHHGNHREAAKIYDDFEYLHLEPSRPRIRQYQRRGNFCDCKPNF
jgi:hypothetical protein